MRILIQASFSIFLFSLCIFSQELSRPQKIEELRTLKTKIDQTRAKIDQMEEEHQKIYEDLAFINEKDAEEAKSIGAVAHRLYPDRILDDLVDFPEGGSASVHSFDEVAGEYDSPSIEFENGSLVFTDESENRKNFGFISNIGGTLLETISEKSPEFIALAKYESPTEIKNVKSEFESDGLTFKSKATVIVGNTYLLRAIRLGAGGGIFAIKVHRKDSDGSIIIFVKTIKVFESPASQSNISTNKKPSTEVDYESVQKAQNELLQKGFNDVALDTSTFPMTLRGTVPKGKLADVIELVMEIISKPVRNELTEK